MRIIRAGVMFVARGLLIAGLFLYAPIYHYFDDEWDDER